MANINIENIYDLDLNGNDLFEDSESFITELSEDNEIEAINGGLIGGICVRPSCLEVSCIRLSNVVAVVSSDN